MAKTAAEWEAKPKFPATHYVDSRVYTDEAIFEEEKEKLFRPSWIIACHESEMAAPYDYRLFNHPAGVPLIVIRGDDSKVRAFYNICPHRGNTILYDPSGNAKRLTCIFHQWSFDSRGNCVDISRAEQGYQERFCKEDAAMREVKCEVGYGGFVWVNLTDDALPLREFIGGAMDILEPYMQQPMEVFHYHKARVRTNFKLWHDTNSEFYHDFLHYFNRITGMMQPGYFDRKYTGFPNGHATVGSMQIQYDKYDGSKERAVGWPGLARGGWYMVDVFPGMTYNLRTSVLRIDTAIPLGPNEVIIEFRGLGPESRHRGGAPPARVRPQHDLGAVRPQPARGPARRARPGARDARAAPTAAGCCRAARRTARSTTRSACATTTPSGRSAWGGPRTIPLER